MLGNPAEKFPYFHVFVLHKLCNKANEINVMVLSNVYLKLVAKKNNKHDLEKEPVTSSAVNVFKSNSELE